MGTLNGPNRKHPRKSRQPPPPAALRGRSAPQSGPLRDLARFAQLCISSAAARVIPNRRRHMCACCGGPPPRHAGATFATPSNLASAGLRRGHLCSPAFPFRLKCQFSRILLALFQAYFVRGRHPARLVCRRPETPALCESADGQAHSHTVAKFAGHCAAIARAIARALSSIPHS